MPCNTSLSSMRLASYSLLLALLISSCSTSSPSDAYPTYDPFAPVNATSAPGAIPIGENISSARSAGPTPTRAAVSVTLPPHNSNSASTTPTPDLPHPLPTQRDYLDQYTVQAGDTLGSIARAYGISLEALMQAN